MRKNFALDFNGATPDYVEILAAFTQLDFTSEAFTIIARLNTTLGAAHASIFTRGLINTDGYWFDISPSGVLEGRTFQGGASQTSSSTSGAIVSGNYYTVGMTRDGATVILFKNGVDVTDVHAVHVNPLTSARSAKIGVYDDKASYPFDGKIDELVIFRRALSPAEMLFAHNGGTGDLDLYDRTSLVAWWRMNEGAGVSIFDVTGNDITGTITGASWVAGKDLLPIAKIPKRARI